MHGIQIARKANIIAVMEAVCLAQQALAKLFVLVMQIAAIVTRKEYVLLARQPKGRPAAYIQAVAAGVDSLIIQNANIAIVWEHVCLARRILVSLIALLAMIASIVVMENA